MARSIFWRHLVNIDKVRLSYLGKAGTHKISNRARDLLDLGSRISRLPGASVYQIWRP